ncbi:hypothetical protein TWF730_002116 [Orbilia blumenaviensis]|uniref:Uncharacterized protein n=1 Tax=Orbilia blumenaviensis TaxID=1796055 RepID=A0AAV9UG53_9PEZI
MPPRSLPHRESPSDPLYHHGHGDALSSPADKARLESRKRVRALCEAATRQSPLPGGHAPIEIIDLTSGDDGDDEPPSKRQKREHSPSTASPAPIPVVPSSPASPPSPSSCPPLSPSSSSSSSSDRAAATATTPPSPSSFPLSPPPVPQPADPPKKKDRIFIDLTGLKTTVVPSSGYWRNPSSNGSAFSGMLAGGSATTTTSTTTLLPPPHILLPPWGPEPLGNNWEQLGPLDQFPPDPLEHSYEPPATSLSFPEGPSSKEISSNPELAFLFHVKSVGTERFYAKPVSETDSICMLPSTITTSFYKSHTMDNLALEVLEQDMKLARKMGFLPFRTPEHAMNAVMRYTKGNKNSRCIYRLDGALSGDYGKNDEDTRKNKKRLDGYGDGYGDSYQSLDADWYPGRDHFRRMVREWMASHPSVRAIRGVPGFTQSVIPLDGHEVWFVKILRPRGMGGMSEMWIGRRRDSGE